MWWESLKSPSVNSPACKGRSSQHYHLHPCAKPCLNKGQFPESIHKFLEDILSQQPSHACFGICTAVERSLTCYAAAWSTQFSSHLKEDRRHNNKGKAEIRASFPCTLLSRKVRLLKKLKPSKDPKSHSQTKTFHRRENVSLSHQLLPQHSTLTLYCMFNT